MRHRQTALNPPSFIVRFATTVAKMTIVALIQAEKAVHRFLSFAFGKLQNSVHFNKFCKPYLRQIHGELRSRNGEESGEKLEKGITREGKTQRLSEEGSAGKRRIAGNAGDNGKTWNFREANPP